MEPIKLKTLITIFMLWIIAATSVIFAFRTAPPRIELPGQTIVIPSVPLGTSTTQQIQSEYSIPYYSFFDHITKSKEFPSELKLFINNWATRQKDTLAEAMVKLGRYDVEKKVAQYGGYILLNPKGDGEYSVSQKLCIILFSKNNEGIYLLNDSYCSTNPPDTYQYENFSAVFGGPEFVDLNRDGVNDFIRWNAGGGGSGGAIGGGILAIDPVTQKMFKPKTDQGKVIDGFFTLGSPNAVESYRPYFHKEFSFDSSPIDFIDAEKRMSEGSEISTVISCDYKAYHWDYTKKVFRYLPGTSIDGKKELCGS